VNFRYALNQVFHFTHDIIMRNQFTTISGGYALGYFFNLPSVSFQIFLYGLIN
jgi:hypothetical protein